MSLRHGLTVMAGAVTVAGASVLYRSREHVDYSDLPWANTLNTPPRRDKQISELKRSAFDLLIIGGELSYFLTHLADHECRLCCACNNLVLGLLGQTRLSILSVVGFAKCTFRENVRGFPVWVLAGGATGTGAALDAAMRGLKVALVEQEDFAAGTSSRSTKLIHGGVRYLEKAFWQVCLLVPRT
eukprot:1178076-Prorocentrum_minimum.AAC.1